MTGFNIINNLLAIVTMRKLKIPLDLPVVRFIAQKLLVRELNMYFCRIRREDEALSFQCLNEFSEEQID